MTHDEIIEMARQALKQEPREDWNSTAWVFADETLEAFAKLVAEKALAQPEQDPICPDCKAKVLYECVACSSNNYPPKENA